MSQDLQVQVGPRVPHEAPLGRDALRVLRVREGLPEVRQDDELPQVSPYKSQEFFSNAQSEWHAV